MQSDRYRIIAFDGGLDVSRYPDFRFAFQKVADDVPLVVDLTAVEHVDSTFLSELLMLRRRRESPMVVVVEPRSNVARIMEIVEFSAKMTVVHDVPAALAACGVQPEEV